MRNGVQRQRKHIVISARSNFMTAPTDGDGLDRLNVSPAIVTDASGKRIAIVDPVTRRRYPASEIARVCRKLEKRRAEFERRARLARLSRRAAL